MSCTSARWSWTTRKWASAPKMHRHCGRENWQPRAERQSHKTRRRCIVHSAKVRCVSVHFCVQASEKWVVKACSCLCVSIILHSAIHVWIFVCRCSQEQAWGGVVAPVPSAPAASQTATASASPGHLLPGPAQAAHRTAACYSGGFRCAHNIKTGSPAVTETEIKVMEFDCFYI